MRGRRERKSKRERKKSRTETRTRTWRAKMPMASELREGEVSVGHSPSPSFLSAACIWLGSVEDVYVRCA